MIELNKIWNEDCRTTMARFLDNSIDSCICSPPYYGLRSYGTEPQVWGGDESCEHVWGEDLKNPKADLRTPEEKIAQGGTVGTNVATLHWSNGSLGNFCQLCNAWKGELGLEPTFHLFISHLIEIFREVKRALKPSGTVWVNLGDSFASSSPCNRRSAIGNGSPDENTIRTSRLSGVLRSKSLMNIPHRFAIAMTDELQFLQRNNINWWKRACMPSSAKDRFTVDFESIFFFTKNPKYYFEQQLEPFESSIKEIARQYSNGTKETDYATNKRYSGGVGYGQEGRNMRTTWDIPFEPSGEDHYAAYPTRLVERMIRCGCPEGGIVYDPFAGTATTCVTAYKLGRQWIGSELNPKYAEIANKRLEPYVAQDSLF